MAVEGAPENVNILVLSSYPPTRCGIAQYAMQQVQHLRQQGHEVRVMAIDGRGDVDYRLGLTTWDQAVEAVGTMSQFDKIIVHFAPGLFPLGPEACETFFQLFRKASRTLTKVQFEVVMHESDYPIKWRRRWSLNRVWRSANVLFFHTESERARFAKHFRGIRSKRMQVVPHAQDFAKFYDGTYEEARRELGIPSDCVAFVSCGFFYEGKGFDRAISVFRDAADLTPDAHYYVVGTPRVLEHAPYGDHLKEEAAAIPNVTVVNAYLDDETFDQWIAAADCIVLPYRRVWSSGVMARAALYARPVITTDVGGLRDQAGPDDIIVDDDRALAESIKDFAMRHRSGMLG